MFSPVKVIAAAALTAAIMSMLLIAQPFEQDASAPGAEPDVKGESTGVTGTSVCSSLTEGTLRELPLPYAVTDLVLRCYETASDPRVSGRSTVAVTIEGWGDGLKVHDPANSITWNDYTLEGPEGTWSGQGYGFYDADGVAHLLAVATGSGAYEGLTYLQSFSVPVGSATSATIGLIQTGPAPAVLPLVSSPSSSNE